MKRIAKATKDRIIYLNKKNNSVTYLLSGKTRSLNNPEEEVQLDTYLSLVYDYHYPAERISVCQPVKMGSATKEADIIVYADDACNAPYLIVECKKKGVSSNVFEGAVDQGFSYASATMAKFIWVTDGDNNAYYEVFPHAIGERDENILPDIPSHNSEQKVGYKFRKQFYRLFNAPLKMAPFLKYLFQKPLFTQTLAYSVLFVAFMVLFSKLSVMYFSEVYKVLRYFWENHGADFGWIYNTMAFVSSGLAMVVSSRLQLLPKSVRPKRSTLFWLTVLLFIPIWFVGAEYRSVWWNWQHYSDMNHKAWIYLEPMFFGLPLQMIVVAVILWLSQLRFGHTKTAQLPQKSSRKRKAKSA
ncbi:type I restriction enzyme HsdR N-terminal domain-containing protein [Limibacter armeniacum]|uniref:type I restriction enzyme HsdR N-terminal domain-containing protein n=1 Tax=Limibacter armeniacum TaxID=466084 RepID=UPI002FE67246